MKTSIETFRNDQQGFTLVELAVVMIIIGLLIGGILKGQELITNARITTTASTMESFSAAFNGFRDKYNNATPGDFGNAVAQIAACANIPACVDGDDSGIVNPAVGTAAGNNEGVWMFGQLLAADFITGMDGSDNGAAAAFGVTNPTAPVGGGFLAGDARSGAPTGFAPAHLRASPYIVLSTLTAAVGAASGSVTDQQAAVIDRRIDDGVPNAGSVVSQTTANTCGNAAAAGAQAYSANDTPCVIAYRLQ